MYHFMTAEDFSIAYLIGYEVEETVEDKLLKLYKSNPINGCDYNEGYADGMADSLDVLNIKIKGINE